MHIVDRRLNPGGKSLENRQRFLRRARGQLKRAVYQSTQGRDVQDILKGGEIGIPLDGMEEPRLHRGSSGSHQHILPGNKQFVEGDIIQRPEGGGGGGKPRDGGEGVGEDAFRFILTREEFLDLFLDDLELPDLAKRRLANADQVNPVRAGYSVTGSPANIAVNRTMRLAMMRRVALHRPKPERLAQLNADIAECADLEHRLALEAEVKALEAKSRRIPYIDPIDIRYRRFDNEPKPVAQAVMFCLMDVSGSMSEHMKDLAKRFYMLLYIFLTRQYRRVEIVFIRHTDRAEEVDEDTFFHSPATGGTQVSSALETMQKIVLERYPPADWNIYGAQASDGDNAHSDGTRTEQLLNGAILPISQYFAYLEVAEAGRGSMSRSALWTLYERIRSGSPQLSMRKVSSRSEIYPVFHDLFQRRPA
ncbi:YeaH/YhbH family protein [Starkeya sp. ORNL1]|uniref:YeaH/YhbH family protein n=1 Tax=Starkeya sp. ORNL1 TaxID=2709380 RepID=UPI0014642640|nr:YeaH/YhbH family protein [Starkeya sp. ORNL1]QJP16297.1 YeaH/YhbH family protein [Starkeya sp. ORNL1]